MFKKIVSIGKTLLGELDAAVDLEVSDKQEANREVSKRLRLLNNKLASMVEKKERYVALLHNVKGWSKKRRL